jgi:hypothetical protein
LVPIIVSPINAEEHCHSELVSESGIPNTNKIHLTCINYADAPKNLNVSHVITKFIP